MPGLHFPVLSDPVDREWRSCIFACLMTACLYTIIGMVSAQRVAGVIVFSAQIRYACFLRTPGDMKTYLWAPPERGEATHGKEERFNLEAQSRSPDKATGISQPKFGESHAQASEGNLHLPQTRSCAIAGVIPQPIACRSARLSHQLHEKGVGQGQQTKQFETGFPVVDAQALDGHFAFQVAEGHLTMPPASVSQDHFPGVFCRLDHLVGE